MYSLPVEFTQDWFSHHIPIWEQRLGHWRGKPVWALEVGSYEGRSALWMLENLLTHPDSYLVCIDPFNQPGFTGREQEHRFNRNLAHYSRKIMKVKKCSRDVLPALERGKFSIIYIDGSHLAADVLEDAVLAWPLLVEGGNLIFDDYEWGGHLPPSEQPKTAIDAFLSAYQGRYEVQHRGVQIFLKKLSSPCTRSG